MKYSSIIFLLLLFYDDFDIFVNTLVEAFMYNALYRYS